MDKQTQDRIKDHFEKMHQEGVTPWKNHPDEPLLNTFFELVKSTFTDPKLLDAGCGDGWISIKAAQLAIEVWGIDGSPTAIAKAQAAARTARVEHKTHFRVSDILSLPLQHDFFDAMIDRGLFHHIIPENRSVYLQNILKVLRQHALVYLSVFSKENPEGIGQRFEKQDIIHLFVPHFDLIEFLADRYPTNGPAHLYHFILRKK